MYYALSLNVPEMKPPSSIDNLKIGTWPTTVKCDMKIDEWRNQLEKHGLLESYGFLLNGFAEGFHQGVPDHSIEGLKFYCPPNHKSAEMARGKIEKNIEKEVQEKRMFGPFEKEEVYKHMGFFRTSPLGAVENGDGSFRPINDMSFPKFDTNIPSVNSFVNKEEFETTWDDFKIVSTFLRHQQEEIQFGIFDWEGAYRQIPTHPSQWRFLAIQDFNELIYIDVRIAFGGVAGCGSFGGPADGWKELMKAAFNLLDVFRWVDDNLMIKLATQDTTMLDIVKASERLGVKTNVTKYAEFADEQKFIGFIWNCKNKTVRIPPQKLDKRKDEINEFLSQETCSMKELQRFAGKLSHLTLVLPQLKCYLVEAFRGVATWKTPGRRAISADVREDITYWKEFLRTVKPTFLVPDHIVKNVGWVGDASTDFGIGIIIGKDWGQFKWLPGWDCPPDRPRRTIAWAETVTVRLGLLMLQEKLRKSSLTMAGQKYSCLTDNTTTKGAARNRKSRDFWVNQEWRVIQRLLLDLDCDINLVRVTSADNEADKLSRGCDPSRLNRHMLKIRIPSDLADLLFQVVP